MKRPRKQETASTSVDLLALRECVEQFATKTILLLGDFVADELQRQQRETCENGWRDSSSLPPRRSCRRDRGKPRGAVGIAQARCTWVKDSQGLAAASTISAVIAVMHR